VPSSRPELEALRLGGTAEPWERFGLDVEQPVGGVRLSFEGGEPGIRDWVLGTPSDDKPTHPNGITAIDHVVLVTRDLEAKVAELVAGGFDHRPKPGAPQAFFVLGPCLLEVVQADGEGFWGITFTGTDLDRFGGTPKDAVQPGRRIVTVPREAGLGFPVAVITPRAGA
jgi:hypothetical protein